jgi:hypothetical protein
MKITFEDGERFGGRKLVIVGELLSNGFAAFPDTMKWLNPFADEEIDDESKSWIIRRISKENPVSGFEITFEDGD